VPYHPYIVASLLTPFHKAAFEADLPALGEFLAKGYDPNEPALVRDEGFVWRKEPGPSYAATPLMLASSSASKHAAEAVRLLLVSGADPSLGSTVGDTALWFAAAFFNSATARALLDGGARPNQLIGNEMAASM